MKTLCCNGNSVERFYEPVSRSSVTRVLDPKGNQIGDAEYDGNAISAEFSKQRLIRENGGKAKMLWYRRTGERVSAKRVSEAHAWAVEAKRLGYPASKHAMPGMSSQPTLADSIEKMTDIEFASYSGLFTFRIVQA